MRPQIAVRIRDILGALSLAVWLAMVALTVFASVAILDRSPPNVPRGTSPPPQPDGCFHEIDGNLSIDRFVCRGTPADGLIGGTLNYARGWVSSILWGPILVLLPPLWPAVWKTVLPSALSLGLAIGFVRRCLVRRRAARAAGNPEDGLR